MKRCIDCLYKFSCGKANSKIVCDRYTKVHGTVTRLEEKDKDSYKFAKMEEKKNGIWNKNKIFTHRSKRYS